MKFRGITEQRMNERTRSLRGSFDKSFVEITEQRKERAATRRSGRQVRAGKVGKLPLLLGSPGAEPRGGRPSLSSTTCTVRTCKPCSLPFFPWFITTLLLCPFFFLVRFYSSSRATSYSDFPGSQHRGSRLYEDCAFCIHTWKWKLAQAPSYHIWPRLYIYRQVWLLDATRASKRDNFLNQGLILSPTVLFERHMLQ